LHILEALVLGFIQGLTEFIPISSSAHLAVIPWLFGWQTPGLVFDVALHLGTLFALFSYFWREWYEMLAPYLGKRGHKSGVKTGETMLLWPIVLACIPAAISGMVLEDTVEEAVRTRPLIIAILMIGLGVLLFVADRIGRQRRSLHEVRLSDWLVIGLAQSLAIFPGVSRSGITITAGLLCGLERESSARFSFLLGAPIILGAGIYKLRDLFTIGLPPGEILPFILGVVAATLVGYICIGFLLAYLKKRSVGIFVVYRILFGVFLIAMVWLRG